MGGNLGEPVQAIENALNHLHSNGVLYELVKSRYYRTEGWGGASGDFVNCAVLAKTPLSAEALLDSCQAEENLAGRQRTGNRFADRTLDIDILLYGDERIDSQRLTIPHYAMTERRFVLIPLAEIAGDWIVTGYKKTILELLHECSDNLRVDPLEVRKEEL